jgi:ubiquitin
MLMYMHEELRRNEEGIRPTYKHQASTRRLRQKEGKQITVSSSKCDSSLASI